MAHERILAAFPRRPIAIEASQAAKDAKNFRLVTLALLDRRGRPILLDSDLSALDLSEEERAAILNA